MAYFEPLIRMDENAFRAPEKMHPRGGRKPLSDMTNSRKPLAKDKSEKGMAPPKAGRKPLGDLTNSTKPHAQEKSSKKNCVENVSAAANKGQAHSFGLGEGFLHNHDECIKANKQSLTMSMDYFLETVALKRDNTPLIMPQLSQQSKALELEVETPMKIDEMEFDTFDMCAPASPAAPRSPWSSPPRSPGSPCWLENMELSPLKLKESPIKGSI